MYATPVAPLPPAPPPRRMPLLVNALLVFFYVLILGNLTYFTWLATAQQASGGSAFWAPVLAFVLLYGGFFAYNWYRRVPGAIQLSQLCWGSHGDERSEVVFVLLGLACVAWLTAAQPLFASLYLSLLPQTLGMFRWRIALPLIGLELLVFAYQTAILRDILSIQSASEFWGVLIGLAFLILYTLIIKVLISSRMQSEMLVLELRQTQQRLEAALLYEREAAALRERTRMAREMHDVLGHALALVAVKIEAAQRLQAVDPARATAELDATKALVRDSMADLRASLADLRSPTPAAGAGPLGAALTAWATRTAAEGGFQLRCTVEPAADALPAPIQDALWRVAREAILNVVKHARAATVELHVFCKAGSVYLSVGDDGVGIPHLADGQARLEVAGHYGVRGMRERLAALGGNLSIRPGPTGRGTLVLATIPLPPPALPATGTIRDHLPPALNGLFRRNSH